MTLRLPLLAALLLASLLPAPSFAESPASPTLILDSLGYWRTFNTLKPPLLQKGAAAGPINYPQSWLNEETPEPPADWTKPDFDDAAWPRQPGRLFCHTPYLAHLATRGKFTVTDPAAVKNLTLNLTFTGGAVAYLNGQEFARANIAKDAQLADPYPADAFSRGDAKTLAPKRERKLNVPVPAKLLKQGVNVLAIEIFRSPYDQEPVPPKEKSQASEKLYWMAFNTCDLLSAQLTASDPAGITPNVSRPAGIQAWNNDILNSDYDIDYGDPNESLRPVAAAGPRNGVLTAKLVLGSDKPLKNLRVTTADLKSSDGSIPASAIRVRYAIPWGTEYMTDRIDVHGAPATLLGALADTAPKEVFLSPAAARRPGQPALVPGAVVPVWFDIKIPSGAKPGVYKTQITLQADGQKAVTATLQATVLDCQIPEPQDFNTWVELIESPDTLALEYNTDLWSDKHWQLIEQSFKLFHDVGSRTVYIPLIAHANLGNEQSMVRWIDKGDNHFEYDFSIMDKYLDLAEKNMGTPRAVIFNVWDVYMIPNPKNGGVTSGGSGGHRRMVNSFDAVQAAKLGTGPLVTLIDPATQKTENVFLPVYADAKSKAIWKPLLDQIQDHMKKRGLEKAAMLGMVTDALPTKTEVEFFHDIAPDMPWVSEGHGGFENKQLLQNIAPLGYQTSVWMTRFADEVLTHGVLTKPQDHLHGWARPDLVVDFERNTDLFNYPTARWFFFGESNITGAQRGMGRIAGDYWLVLKNKRGKREGTATTRFPESAWMNLNICNPILAPGPDGPLATTRFEAFREGIQECEARIAIEKALSSETLKNRLGPDLANRCAKTLDDRMPIMWRSLSNLSLIGTDWGDARLWRWTPGPAGDLWFLNSNWQGRTQTLYTLAGEVAQKTPQK